MVELPFIPGIIIFLVIFIVFIRIYMEIANHIGETIRIFFIKLWQAIKNL